MTLTDPETIARFKDISSTLRRERPVCPVSSGGVLLLRTEDVKSAFSDQSLSNQPSRFSALAPKNKDKYVAASVASHILPFLDGPEHIAMRKWASRAFFQHLRGFDSQIGAISAKHCQAIEAGQSYKLVEDLARRYVVDVIGAFIGMALEPAEMKRCTSALFRLFAPAYDAEAFAQTNEGLAFARKCLQEALDARRADQRPCLLNALDASYPEDFRQEDRDFKVIDNALLFLADGVENVEAAIGVVMMRHAETGEGITPEFVRQAIIEDTPGQTIARIASQDMVIKETAITAGTPVFLSLASANDGAEPKEDVTFGRGRHKCLGENFALSMVTCLCSDIAARAPHVDSKGLTYRAMFGHKWPRDILITLAR